MADSRWRRMGTGMLLASVLTGFGASPGGALQSTTTALEPTTTVAPSTTVGPTSTQAPTTTAAPSTTTEPPTTAPPEEEPPSPTTARPSPTTAATASTAKPTTTATTAKPSATTVAAAVATTAKVPATSTSSGSKTSVVPVAGSAADSGNEGGSKEKQVVWIIGGLLCVVGLLIATLTWRYWWFTDPRRGYTRSRAVLGQALAHDEEDTGVVRVFQDGEVIVLPDPAPAAVSQPVVPSASDDSSADWRTVSRPPSNRRRPPAHRRTRR